MKFILSIEENGYELRYWDEIEDEVGESIISTWDANTLHRQLVDMNFNIAKKTIVEAIALVDSGDKDFVIIASKNKPNHLDTLHEDVFVIEE